MSETLWVGRDLLISEDRLPNYLVACSRAFCNYLVKLAWLFLLFSAALALLVSIFGSKPGGAIGPDAAIGFRSSVWPPKEVAYVVGYCYDFIQDERGYQLAFGDGSIHSGVFREVRLTSKQEEELLHVVATRVDEQEEGDCHFPHHGFILFDSSDKPVGWISVCLECGTYDFSSNRAPDSVDFEKLRGICRDLGFPEFQEPEDYTRLYRATLDEDDDVRVVTWREWSGAGDTDSHDER